MNQLKRQDWPEWLQRLRMPWRFIAGRVEDVQRFTSVYQTFRNNWFHYSSPKHVESVKTIWPFLFIESKDGDDIAAFLANQMVTAAWRGGNKVIVIPRSVLESGTFPIEVCMIASTLVEIAHKRDRETKKAKAVHVTHTPIPLSL